MMSTEETLRLTVAALMQLTRERQPDVAAAIGLTQPQLSRRQNGKAGWTLTDCDRLAAHWGMPTLDLLAGPTHAAERLPADRRPTTGIQTTAPTQLPPAAPPPPTTQPRLPTRPHPPPAAPPRPDHCPTSSATVSPPP
ncbi:XRE family transcriptional regulator [Streptomyces sp. SM18]|uniref:XRE family transcriptional regulator n=1 Tax=Streptomyces sp. SM18 TaxID=1736046 RepID=UPI00215A9315|nr:XRE family transcriptional regulator [Streptomyces sp. SM18]